MWTPRRLFQPKQQSASAITGDPGNDVLGLLLIAAFSAATVTVSVAEAAVPTGVTEFGEKLHDAPKGRPEQRNETGDEYPLRGVIRTVAVPLCPGTTVTDAGRRLTPKVAVAISGFTV
jgi:hypothetical protein